jgi:methyl-accepting chemotaxis protein
MGTSKNAAKNGPKTSINTKIAAIFAIMLVVTILLAECIALSFGYGMIRDLINTSLQNEVSSDAGKINRELNATFYYLNGVGDAVEQNTFSNNMELRSYLEGTVGRYDMIPTGVYLALDDGTFIYPADPSIEDGFVATEKAWYLEAMDYTNSWFYYYDVPYFDTAAGQLCATVQRHVQMKDGREGVFDADLMMGSIQEILNQVQLYETGKAIMITTSGLILSYPDTSMCGTNVADYPDDAFLQGISTLLTSEDGQVTNVNAGGTYYACSSTVDGTDWKVIIYAKQSEVLAAVFKLALFLIIFTVAAVIVVLVIMLQMLYKTIRKPVTSLTNNIEKIAGGDFTVEVTSKGNDEIAYMNSAMGDFISGMRDSLREIKEVTAKLMTDAQASKDTAESLETAAVEQSTSMNQIKGNVENMSNSVTEVAESATTLAQAITDVTEGEKQIETAMTALVEKADAGQHDMKTVAEGMDDVVASMNDMAEAVKGVDEAAEKITQIVDDQLYLLSDQPAVPERFHRSSQSR